MLPQEPEQEPEEEDDELTLERVEEEMAEEPYEDQEENDVIHVNQLSQQVGQPVPNHRTPWYLLVRDRISFLTPTRLVINSLER